MGAGILPVTIRGNKLYFLFGKENKYEKSAPGYSDFGGGSDNSEDLLETAVREAGEELTGFLGEESEVRRLLTRCGTYNMDLMKDGKIKYRIHMFPMEYNPWLEYYYNNNQRFLQEHLPQGVIKQTKIFEKEHIKWVCVDDLRGMRSKFRHFFREMVDKLIAQQGEIKAFMSKCFKGKSHRKSQRNVGKKLGKRGTRRHRKSF